MSLEEWADLHGEDYPKGKFFSALDYGRGDRDVQLATANLSAGFTEVSTETLPSLKI